MISISIFRINAKNRTIWCNLIQTSVPLVYTNYFYNIYCPNMGGSRGGGGTGGPPPHLELPDYTCICFCHVEIFRQTPSGNLDPPPPRENFLDPRMPNTIFQNLFFKIITSLANIYSNLFSPREILRFFFLFQYRFSFYLCDNFLNVTE